MKEKVNSQIGPFKLYTQKPNDITCGHLYTMEVKLPVPFCKRRTIRVYLPENFNIKEKYPVIYMSDGQNIVDKYTTAYGAWNIDVAQHSLIKEGYPSFIVVGIDCPKVGHKYRAAEYSLSVPMKHKYNETNFSAYSEYLMDYVVNELKPLIDKHFPTRKEREYTAFGGSSMGGLAAFNFATRHKETFGFCLSFSPAFFLYQTKPLKDYIENLHINPIDYGRFFFYVGGSEFESEFLKDTFDMYCYFREHGFDTNQVSLLVDSTQKHCEAAWEKHFPDAIRFWLG